MTEAAALLTESVGSSAAEWDLRGSIPAEIVRALGAKGVLCAEVGARYGGLGLSGLDGGELAAHAGTLCSSLRSLMTSQGMAAWSIQRFGSAAQRREYLSRLTGAELAAMAFSETGAGSDLSAIETRISPSGDGVVVDGVKTWITAAAYADFIVTIGRYGAEAAAVVVPVSAPGVRVEPVAYPLGCRAAGHSTVRLESVRLSAGNVLSGQGFPLPLLITTTLTFGRLSVAWGCVGILRACLAAATRHAGTREQSGSRLAGHQLVARHLAELYTAERTATQMCREASLAWDSRSPQMGPAAVLAKYVAAGNAARGAAAAVQVLASAGATDGGVVARAYRDAKLMEIIEGSTEICQLVLAEQAMTQMP